MELYFLNIVAKGKNDIPPEIYFPIVGTEARRVKKEVSSMLEHYLFKENSDEVANKCIPVLSIEGGIFHSEGNKEILWKGRSLTKFLNKLDEWEKQKTGK